MLALLLLLFIYLFLFKSLDDLVFTSKDLSKALKYFGKPQNWVCLLLILQLFNSRDSAPQLLLEHGEILHMQQDLALPYPLIAAPCTHICYFPLHTILLHGLPRGLYWELFGQFCRCWKIVVPWLSIYLLSVPTQGKCSCIIQVLIWN